LKQFAITVRQVRNENLQIFPLQYPLIGIFYRYYKSAIGDGVSVM